MKRNRKVFGIVFLLTAGMYFFTKSELIPYLLCLLLVYVFMARLSTLFPQKNIEISLSVVGDGKKGEPAEVRLRIENKGYFPLLFSEFMLEAENLLTGRQTSFSGGFSMIFKRRKEIVLSLGDKYCGCIRVQMRSLYLSDPLKLFQREILHSKACSAQYFVLPSIGRIPVSEEFDAYSMESYRYSATVKGTDSGETFGIREYVPGDNVKAIHWKLSGKIGEPVIREFGFPIENRIMVICSRQLRMERELTDKEKEQETELYLSLLFSLAEKGITYATGWYDSRLKVFYKKWIRSEADAEEVVPDILKTSFSYDKTSAIQYYLGEDLEHNFTGYLYVTVDRQNEEEDIERLENYGTVIVYESEKYEE